MGKDTKKAQKKRQQVSWIVDLLGKYQQIVQVSLANVTAGQFKQIHKECRLKGGVLVVLKNTLIRKAVDLKIGGTDMVKAEKYEWAREFITEKADELLPAFRPLLKKQNGYIFTNEPVFELKPRIENLTVPAAAKLGMEAQKDVNIQPGPTGMDPSQISFFHALQISTKIVKGQIEIQKEYKVCTEGKKIGPSQVQLLKSMNIKPFSYGMKVLQMYDAGSVLDNATCSISPLDVIKTFQAGVANITALSLETGITTELSAPHAIINSFKSLAAIGLEIDYKFDFLTNLQSSSSSAPAKSADTKVEKTAAKAPVVEEKEPSEEGMDMNLFGDDDEY